VLLKEQIIMPVSMTKLKSGKVRVSTPNGVKSKGSTPANAKRQRNLLNAVEHGWKPTGAPARDAVKRKVMSGGY
jgi:hypothetical protein